MDIREVRHQSNPLNEPQDRGYRPQSLCPDCSSELFDGDRFCQECGARVTASRAKKHAREIASEQAQEPENESAKANKKTREPGRGRETQFTANILCINCGAKNSPVSSDCNFCKKALVPDSEDGTGRKTFLRDFLVQGKPQRMRLGKDTLGAPGTSPSLERGTTGDDTSRAQRLAASSERNVGLATKQRIPRAFASPSPEVVSQNNDTEDDLELLFSTTSEHSEEWTPESKSDRIAAEKRAFERSQRPEPALGKLIVESNADGFSLTAVQMIVEAFFERIPVPVLLFVGSMIIIVATINLTTEWQKQEQRLTALDKLASHAEDDMKAYKLDDAVIAMTELEKTEGGNLPPRARSVLNQSLWLRAYAYAKKNRYDLATEDMKRVTSAFNSYDDAQEKLDEYKEDIKLQEASAKNLPRPSIGPGDAVASSSPDLESTDDDASEPGRKIKKADRTTKSQATEVKPAKANELKPANATERRTAAIELKAPQVTEPRASNVTEAKAKNVAEPKAPKVTELKVLKVTELKGMEPGTVAEKQAKKKAPADNLEGKEGKMSSGAAHASDSKRYSNLLIKYFSEAHDSEPPSFEEWQSSGKKDF